MPLASFTSARQTGGEEGTRSFDSPTAEILAQSDPVSERGTLYVLALMIFGLMAIICFVKLDRVVSATGRLVPIGGALTVQPLETQIISRVVVSVGDVVKKGQVLAICDPTFSRADRVRLEQEVASFDAQMRRMTAEEQGQNFVGLPGKPYDALQAQIFLQRQNEYRSGVGDFDQRIRGAEAQLAGLRKDIGVYQSRLKIGSEMEGMNTALAKDGYVSRLQVLTVQDQQAELGRQLSDAENTLTSTSHLLDSLKEERKVFVEKWRDDNLTALVTVRNGLEAAQQDLAKADKVSELANLVAPADGVVTRTPNLSVGGVATGAQPLFNLVPINAPLEAQVQIDAQDIGFVRVGDPVNLKFDAFRFIEHGVGKGVVKTISQDAFTDVTTQDAMSQGSTQSRSAFYDARVRVDELQLHDLPTQSRLMAGMTLSADIVVGRRTLLWYLLGGALRSGSEAMREP
jgi:HlyD family type I secretion membrane fusion protein